MEQVRRLWSRLTLLLVGIGALEPSTLLSRSGNALSAGEQRDLSEAGAVGDVCLRYFDRDGAAVSSMLDTRVIGVGVDQIRQVPRRVGVAGGIERTDAVLGAVRGGWVNILITDLSVARCLARPDLL